MITGRGARIGLKQLNAIDRLNVAVALHMLLQACQRMKELDAETLTAAIGLEDHRLPPKFVPDPEFPRQGLPLP
jgi:hypothetical protein